MSNLKGGPEAGRTLGEHRYCGPCGEYYDDGDVFDSAFDAADLAAMDGTECPQCLETGRTVDDLAEAQAKEAASEPPLTADERHAIAWAQKQQAKGNQR